MESNNRLTPTKSELLPRGGYESLPIWWMDLPITDVAFRLAVWLLTHCRRDKPAELTMSRRALAEGIGRDAKTATRALTELADAGVLTVDAKPGRPTEIRFLSVGNSPTVEVWEKCPHFDGNIPTLCGKYSHTDIYSTGATTPTTPTPPLTPPGGGDVLPAAPGEAEGEETDPLADAVDAAHRLARKTAMPDPWRRKIQRTSKSERADVIAQITDERIRGAVGECRRKGVEFGWRRLLAYVRECIEKAVKQTAGKATGGKETQRREEERREQSNANQVEADRLAWFATLSAATQEKYLAAVDDGGFAMNESRLRRAASADAQKELGQATGRSPGVAS